jgi:hypothetical protein
MKDPKGMTNEELAWAMGDVELFPASTASIARGAEILVEARRRLVRSSGPAEKLRAAADLLRDLSGDVLSDRIKGSLLGEVAGEVARIERAASPALMSVGVDASAPGARDWSSKSLAGRLGTTSGRHPEPWSELRAAARDVYASARSTDGRATMGEWARLGDAIDAAVDPPLHEAPGHAGAEVARWRELFAAACDVVASIADGTSSSVLGRLRTAVEATSFVPASFAPTIAAWRIEMEDALLEVEWEGSTVGDVTACPDCGAEPSAQSRAGRELRELEDGTYERGYAPAHQDTRRGPCRLGRICDAIRASREGRSR